MRVCRDRKSFYSCNFKQREREREREMASLARQSCRYVNVKLSP